MSTGPPPTATASAAAQPPRARLRDVAMLFLRLGVTAFGGPAAHISMMENEVVQRRRWVTPERFLDMMGAANLIPGPSSSELAVLIGYEQAGLAGLVVAGVCFILPAALMSAALAWAYVRFGSLPRVGGVLYGVKPVIIAIVVQALWGLAPKAIKRSRWLGALGVLAAVVAALGVDALLVLVGAGLVSLAAVATRGARRTKGTGARGVLLFAPTVAASAAAPSAVTLGALFLTFLKLGAVVFGSGYVLLAFLRADLVDRLHWLTESQLIDAVAVGQVTPGPVFTTATFIGYTLAGGWGALLATVAIFLPGFLMIGALRPIVARVRRSSTASAFLDGVNVASLALMAVVTVQLGQAALVDWVTVLLAVGSAVALLRWRVNTTWVIAAAALVGAAMRGVG